MINQEGGPKNTGTAWRFLAEKPLFQFETTCKEDTCPRYSLFVPGLCCKERCCSESSVLFARRVNSWWFRIRNMWNICEIHLESQSYFNYWFWFPLISIFKTAKGKWNTRHEIFFFLFIFTQQTIWNQVWRISIRKKQRARRQSPARESHPSGHQRVWMHLPVLPLTSQLCVNPSSGLLKVIWPSEKQQKQMIYFQINLWKWQVEYCHFSIQVEYCHKLKD